MTKCVEIIVLKFKINTINISKCLTAHASVTAKKILSKFHALLYAIIYKNNLSNVQKIKKKKKIFVIKLAIFQLFSKRGLKRYS